MCLSFLTSQTFFFFNKQLSTASYIYNFPRYPQLLTVDVHADLCHEMARFTTVTSVLPSNRMFYVVGSRQTVSTMDSSTCFPQPDGCSSQNKVPLVFF